MGACAVPRAEGHPGQSWYLARADDDESTGKAEFSRFWKKIQLMTLMSFRSHDTPSGWIQSKADTVGMHLDIFGLGQMVDGEHPHVAHEE